VQGWPAAGAAMSSARFDDLAATYERNAIV
jgi:hypothetical protein